MPWLWDILHCAFLDSWLRKNVKPEPNNERVKLIRKEWGLRTAAAFWEENSVNFNLSRFGIYFLLFFFFFFLTESAYPTKLLLQSIMWNIQIIQKGVSSYQNLGFPPAAQISTILSEIQAVRSLEFKLLAMLLPLIWIIASQNLKNNPFFIEIWLQYLKFQPASFESYWV